MATASSSEPASKRRRVPSSRPAEQGSKLADAPPAATGTVVKATTKKKPKKRRQAPLASTSQRAGPKKAKKKKSREPPKYEEPSELYVNSVATFTDVKVALRIKFNGNRVVGFESGWPEGKHDVELGDELVHINSEAVGSLGRRALPRKLQRVVLPIRFAFQRAMDSRSVARRNQKQPTGPPPLPELRKGECCGSALCAGQDCIAVVPGCGDWPPGPFLPTGAAETIAAGLVATAQQGSPCLTVENATEGTPASKPPEAWNSLRWMYEPPAEATEEAEQPDEAMAEGATGGLLFSFSLFMANDDETFAYYESSALGFVRECRERFPGRGGPRFVMHVNDKISDERIAAFGRAANGHLRAERYTLKGDKRGGCWLINAMRFRTLWEHPGDETVVVSDVHDDVEVMCDQLLLLLRKLRLLDRQLAVTYWESDDEDCLSSVALPLRGHYHVDGGIFVWKPGPARIAAVEGSVGFMEHCAAMMYDAPYVPRGVDEMLLDAYLHQCGAYESAIFMPHKHCIRPRAPVHDDDGEGAANASGAEKAALPAPEIAERVLDIGRRGVSEIYVCHESRNPGYSVIKRSVSSRHAAGSGSAAPKPKRSRKKKDTTHQMAALGSEVGHATATEAEAAAAAALSRSKTKRSKPGQPQTVFERFMGKRVRMCNHSGASEEMVGRTGTVVALGHGYCTVELDATDGTATVNDKGEQAPVGTEKERELVKERSKYLALVKEEGQESLSGVKASVVPDVVAEEGSDTMCNSPPSALSTVESAAMVAPPCNLSTVSATAPTTLLQTASQITSMAVPAWTTSETSESSQNPSAEVLKVAVVTRAKDAPESPATPVSNAQLPPLPVSTDLAIEANSSHHVVEAMRVNDGGDDCLGGEGETKPRLEGFVAEKMSVGASSVLTTASKPSAQFGPAVEDIGRQGEVPHRTPQSNSDIAPSESKRKDSLAPSEDPNATICSTAPAPLPSDADPNPNAPEEGSGATIDADPNPNAPEEGSGATIDADPNPNAPEEGSGATKDADPNPNAPEEGSGATILGVASANQESIVAAANSIGRLCDSRETVEDSAASVLTGSGQEELTHSSILSSTVGAEVPSAGESDSGVVSMVSDSTDGRLC